MEFENESGWMIGDKYPPEKMMGPAVVIDVRAIFDQTEGGQSPLITKEMIEADEAANGEIQAGDVVIFYSGYDDAYYKPFPEGNRLAWDPLVNGDVPAWRAPTPDAVRYLAEKGVTHLAIDSPSMGPTGHEYEGEPMPQMTQVTFLETGGSRTEFLRNVGQLPARGAYFIATSAKIVDMSGGLSRALAIKPKGPGLRAPDSSKRSIWPEAWSSSTRPKVARTFCCGLPSTRWLVTIWRYSRSSVCLRRKYIAAPKNRAQAYPSIPDHSITKSTRRGTTNQAVLAN